MNLSVKDIVDRSKKGDQQAFKQLYDRYAAQMLGVCMRYTHSRDEAQDLLHDGFIKVFEGLNNLKSVDALSSWIYNIMVNTAINYVQRKSAKYEKLVDVTDAMMSAPLNYDEFDVKYLLHLIQQLPDKYRIVFNLHEVEGYSYDEIAKRLKLESSSVRSILCRARQMLQENIKHDEQ